MLTEWLITRKKGVRFFRWLAKVLMHCDVHPDCVFGRNVTFGHGGRGCVIGASVIGNNVRIMHNTTLCNNYLSKDSRARGFPSIDDGAIIGPHCVLMGGITIGKNTIIGAGSFINKDVPSNMVAFTERKTITLKRKK